MLPNFARIEPPANKPCRISCYDSTDRNIFSNHGARCHNRPVANTNSINDNRTMSYPNVSSNNGWFPMFTSRVAHGDTQTSVAVITSDNRNIRSEHSIITYFNISI